jgi:hypothetical protein
MAAAPVFSCHVLAVLRVCASRTYRCAAPAPAADAVLEARPPDNYVAELGSERVGTMRRAEATHALLQRHLGLSFATIPGVLRLLARFTRLD